LHLSVILTQYYSHNVHFFSTI